MRFTRWRKCTTQNEWSLEQSLATQKTEYQKEVEKSSNLVERVHSLERMCLIFCDFGIQPRGKFKGVWKWTQHEFSKWFFENVDGLPEANPDEIRTKRKHPQKRTRHLLQQTILSAPRSRFQLSCFEPLRQKFSVSRFRVHGVAVLSDVYPAKYQLNCRQGTPSFRTWYRHSQCSKCR